MTQFQLDTSGTVDADDGEYIALDGQLYVGVGWGILLPFMQGYIEAALRSIGVDRYDALAPETLSRIIADCERLATGWPQRGKAASSGRKFWADRQGGVYVRNNFPPLTVTLGDDGKVRFG